MAKMMIHSKLYPKFAPILDVMVNLLGPNTSAPTIKPGPIVCIQLKCFMLVEVKYFILV